AEVDASKLSAVCETSSSNLKTASISSESTAPYTVSLLAYNKDDGHGNFIWIWSVENPNPGNGQNGTAQDLSHWGITLGPCAVLKNVVSAATSNNGKDWTSFTPSYKQDKSQGCYSEPV